MLCTSGLGDDVTFVNNEPGKGGAKRACAQNDSPGGSTQSDVYDCLVMADNAIIRQHTRQYTNRNKKTYRFTVTYATTRLSACHEKML